MLSCPVHEFQKDLWEKNWVLSCYLLHTYSLGKKLWIDLISNQSFWVFFFFQCFTSMGNEECSMGFFLKLLPSAAIINGEKNRNAARRNKVFQREVNVTFGILPQIQKAALTKGLSLAIPEIVYGSHDTKVRIYI